MKQLKLLILFILVTCLAYSQQVQPYAYKDNSFPWSVNIGDSVIKRTFSGAYLEVGDSLASKKGILPPRGVVADIIQTTEGLFLYDRIHKTLAVRNDTGWLYLGTGTGSTDISGKLNISDTADMLLPYLSIIDTTGKWVIDIYSRNDSLFKFKDGVEEYTGIISGTYTFSNGLTETSGVVKLGGTLSENTTIDADGNSLTISDGLFSVENSGSVSGIATISGNNSGANGLLRIIDNRATGSGTVFGGYSYSNLFTVFWPNAPASSLTGFLLGKSASNWQGVGLQYYNTANTPAGNKFGISFFGQGNNADSLIPFSFGADTSFTIGKKNSSDRTFKLDVYAKSRFNDAYQDKYASSGGRITDSTLLWKAAIDSLIADVVAGGDFGLLPTTGTGTATGDVIGDLDGNNLIISNDNSSYSFSNTQFSGNVNDGGSFFTTQTQTSAQIRLTSSDDAETIVNRFTLNQDGASIILATGKDFKGTLNLSPLTDSSYVQKQWVLSNFTSLTVVVTGSTTVTPSQNTYYIFTGSSAAAWTLPATGTTVKVKNKGTANITMDVASSGTLYFNAQIDDFIIGPGEAYEFFWDGTDWSIL